MTPASHTAIEGNDTIYIDCDCGTHILKVELESEDAIFQAIYLAMFHYGHSTSKWRRRLRMCWRILTTGEPYSDQIVMNPNEAGKLLEFLQAHLKPNNQNKV